VKVEVEGPQKHQDYDAYLEDADARRIAREKAEEEERNRILAQMQAEYEAMKKAEQEKYKQAKNDFLISLDEALNSFINDLDREYPNGKTVEVFEHKNWIITKVTIKDNLKAIQYLKVKHHWGPSFYFKREEIQSKPYYFCISNSQFNIETGEGT